MESLDRFLEYRVRKLFERAFSAQAVELPVSLDVLAAEAGVVSIEARPMIPEAVLSTGRTSFKIHLQSNFLGAPGVHTRQRFSLAHEIAHTFFYEVRNGRLRPLPYAPKGDELEFACNHGAGLLLVPQQLLVLEVGRLERPIGAACAIELSRKFDVSIEVMLRRMKDACASQLNDVALVLVRRNQQFEAVIDFAFYPPWLKALVPQPERGRSFIPWLRHAVPEWKSDADFVALFETGVQRNTASGLLSVAPYNVTHFQHIFELRV